MSLSSSLSYESQNYTFHPTTSNKSINTVCGISFSNQRPLTLFLADPKKFYERMKRLIPSCNIRIPPELQLPNSDMDIDNEVHVQASTSLWNLDKKQDFVWKGVDFYGNSCNVVADGHGTDIVINILRNINDKLWEQCFNDKDLNPIAALEIYTGISNCNTKGSGACIIMSKVSRNSVDIYSAGDCCGVIYANGIIVGKTKPHDSSLPGEAERFMKRYNTTKEKVLEFENEIVQKE